MDKMSAFLPDTETLQHQFEALREQATKDALSGLLNRVTAEQYIRKRLREMGPEDSCALFIVDMDEFKAVNDTLGHQAGDQAIRQSARVLSGLFRANDIVGRLGGDEFLIFLSGPLITEKLARKKGTAICEELQLSLGSGPVVSLTASVGIYVGAGAGQKFEDLYSGADAALYKAKKSGKHSFCIKNGGQMEISEEFRRVSTIPINGLLEYMDSGVALLEMGESMRLIYVSASFCRLIGADPLSFRLPKPLDEVIHPDDLVGLEAAFREGLEENQVVDHTHRVSPNASSWAWWHIRAVRIAYDNPYPVMLVTTTDVSRFKENERRLEEINERLQTAFDQTQQQLWEVDVQAGTYRRFSQDADGAVYAVRFPDELVTEGRIHPNSVPRFREFAEELLSGRTQGYGNFVVQYHDTGCYGWVAMSYRMLFDEVGRATKAVGILESLPQGFSGQEAKPVLKRSLPEAMAGDLIAGIRANLSQNVVRDVWQEGRDLSGRWQEATCEELLGQEAGRVFGREDGRPFTRQWLLEQFSAGVRWMSRVYRRVDGGGSIHWVRQTSNLVEDPLSHEVYLFLYMSRQNLLRQWEQALGGNVAREPDTGLYTQETVGLLAEAYLTRQTAGSCAAAVVLLGGLSRLLSEQAGARERLRHDMATALSLALGSSCAAGAWGADRIVVFFPEVSSQLELRRRLEGAFTFVRSALEGETSLAALRFVAGVSWSQAAGARYEAMVTQAARVCDLWRNAAEDVVAFSSEEDDWAWPESQAGGDDHITIHVAEMERPLSPEEKDVAFHCVSAMLSADSLEASIQSVLSYIGTYYHADRVYVLMLSENRRVVTMPYEWTDPRKHSIQQAVSGMAVERVPLLQRCMEEMAPVFLTRAHPLARQPQSENVPWYFTVFPLITREYLKGFLCIENSREHPADAALFSTLIPYILRERERFRSRQLRAEGDTPLTSMQNLRSYMGAVGDLTSERYSSMGAICVDIPGLPAINSSLGFQYGSKLLWYVSKALADIFGPTLLFRTWEAEFVALCPNTTRQMFQGRCARFRAITQRRYPKEVRVGYAWAEGAFSGKELVGEARTLMRCEQPDVTTALRYQGDYHSIGEAARAGRFVVFFQPKIDMYTGALYGAEALVRGVDEEGRIIAPSQFIENLERSGAIRDLDLFVLERTLSLVDRWREEGRGLLRVSVNLSRMTLFNSAALASILAIQSRYPQVPADALELEITESVGGVDAGRLGEAVEQFRQLGIRVSLDDFGSRYANLSLFTNVRFDTVKLDRSLIAELVSNPINRMLVQDLVQICQTCGMACIAEGVETAAQIAALKEVGCRYGQGYYYDRPLPVEQFETKYLRSAAVKPARL